MLLNVETIAARRCVNAVQRATCRLPTNAFKQATTTHTRFISSSFIRLKPSPPPRPASDDKRNRSESTRGDPKAVLPTQRWSNSTLIMLASLVGALTYVMGVNNGYNQGKKQGLLDAQLVTPSHPPSIPSQDGQMRADVPAAVSTPS